MRRQHPDPRMSIPISLDVWNKLISASVDSGYEKEDWEVAAEAIYQWTRKNNPNAIPMPAAAGYQWKRLFLPAGTLLRTIFGGKNHHCTVERDQILYNGKPVSPGGFVNAVGGIRRNAWRSIWILFPNSKDWKLADTLRTRVRPLRARTPVRTIEPTLAAQSAAARSPANVPPVANTSPQQIERITAKESEAPNLQQASGRRPASASAAARRQPRAG